ncbi:MAG: hypothetical protein PHX13_05935 [Thiovulaceae bacterium]|nr:hypothetical protein [Sulfurimonadaceae bacterium]
MNPDEIKIRDIKPLLEVPDHSIYLFIAVIIVSLLVLIGLLYLALKWIKTKNRLSLRRTTYQKLLHVDLSDSKKAAYEITRYGLVFKDDSPRNEEMYFNLISRLERYKYKKDVGPFEYEERSYFELYKGMIDV